MPESAFSKLLELLFNILGYGFILVVILFVGFFVFFLIGNSIEQPVFLNCSDGTVHDNCSLDKPYSCFNGSFSYSPQTCGCPNKHELIDGVCVRIYTCEDETIDPDCSVTKPFQCVKGNLVSNAALCGCSGDYEPEGEICVKIRRCDDGTRWGNCSDEKPLFCSSGFLVEKAGACGCPDDFVSYVKNPDHCISKFMTNSRNENLYYVLRGNSNSISIPLFGGLSDYISDKDVLFYCDPVCPSDKEMTTEIIATLISEPHQAEAIQELVDEIEEVAADRDDAARIAISMVQHLDYDWSSFYSLDSDWKYPYEVLYSGSGVCSEKSVLLILMLKQLGFGVAAFEYPDQNHMAVGISCPMEYSADSTGYCFIESTRPNIVTYDDGDYVSAGKLGYFEIIEVSDGYSFDSVSEEYADAQLYSQLSSLSEASGGFLDQYNYYRWLALVDKYDLLYDN